MNSTLLWILRLSAAAVLFGRGWQHIVWDAPYRGIFWDEALLSPIVENVLHMDWDSYVNHPMNDALIRKFIGGIGIFYCLAGLICFLPVRWIQKLRFVLIAASLSLSFLAYLYCKERFYQIGQGIEYASQFLAPYFLVLATGKEGWTDRLVLGIKVAIAMTFFGHGLYAIGYYPVPGSFLDMVIQILGVKQATALQLLYVAGILDFLVAALIFVPGLDWPVLAYAFIWGGATTFARLLGNVDSDALLATLNQWTPEFIMRFPHAGLPLLLLVAFGHRPAYRDWRKRISAVRFSTGKFL